MSIEQAEMSRDEGSDPDLTLLLDVQRDLAESFRQSLGGRLAEIERLAQAVRASPADPQVSGRFHISVHSLAGAAAVYGFNEIAQVARQFDLFLVQRFRTGVLSIPLSALDAFLSDMNQAAAAR